MTTPIEADKKPENPSEQNKMEENLKKIQDQIKELNDGDDNKANDVIEGLQGILNAEFAKILKPDTAKGLLKSIDEYKSKLKNGEKLPDGLQDLIDFLEPIANPIGELKDGEDGIVGLKKGEVTKGQFYGKLEGLNKPKTEDDKQKTEKQDDKKSGDESNTKEGVDKNQASESNVDKNAEGNALQVLNAEIKRVDDLIKVEDGKTLDSRLQTLKTTLSNIQKVVGNPTKDNTMKLQKFIWETCYKDLDSNNAERKRYESENHMKEGKFDGQFGDVTLEGLNKLLAKIEGRIKDVNEAIKVEEKNKEQSTIGSEKVDDKGKDGSNEGKDGSNEGKDESSEGKQKTGGGIDASGGGVSSRASATEVSKDIPKTVTVNEVSYNLLTDYQTLANKNLPGAVFYGLPVEGQNSDFQSMINRVEKSENTSGDIDAIMVYGKDKYQVKFDKFGNLKPTAVNANSKVKVLFEKSCVNYLLNKVPSQIRGDCVIAWNSTMKDYVIRLKGQETGLTIEPIEIDGKGLGTSLEKNLAMLHFTNILRKTKGIDDLPFENDNPDLKWDDGKLLVKVKKNKDIKGLSGSKHRYPVRLDDYALGFLIKDDMSRKNFLKYNNGEDWNDKWDKKDGNKYVKKPLEGQVQVGVVSSGNTPRSQADNVSTNVAARERASQSTEVSHSTESQPSLNNQPELGEVVIMSTIFKPKNPIIGVGAGENEWDIGSKKDANFDGLGKFENGKFTFDANVIGNDGKMSVDKKNYDRVNINNGIFVDGDKKAFTGEGYYLGDIIRDKNNSGKNNIKYLYYGNYKDGLRSGQGTMVFDNGAKYEGEWKEGNEGGNGKYTYTNGDIYEGAFVGGKFEGNGEFRFKDSGIVVSGKFEDNKFVSGNVALNGESYQVERDEKGLKITSEGNNKGKYLDLKNGSVIDVPVNGSEIKKNPTEQASAKQPAVSIEQPAVSIEQPAVSIEQPAVSIEQPAISIEQPAISAKKREQMNQDPENVTKYGFSGTRCQNKESLGIPSGKNVYKKGNDGYFYFKDGDNFVGINPSKPYFKIKTNYAGRPGNKEFNICNAGVDKLNTLLEGIPGSKFEISSDRKNYVLSWDGNGRQTIRTLEEVSSKGNILNIIYGKTKDHYSGKWENNNLREGTFTEGGISYKGKWEKNKITECTSYGNTIKINYDSSGKGYFQAKNGQKLYLSYLNIGTKEPYGKAANTINRIINIVRHSGFKLDQFEEDGGKLQADYEKNVWDTDLLSETSVYNAGFQIKPLVDWLNEYRKDVGI